MNVGDDTEFDDKRDENLDMDLASGVSEVSLRSSRQKSPEPMKQDLSDDEYDDEAIVKKIGMSSSMSSHHVDEISKIKTVTTSSSTAQSSALKDNLGLADSLMSSLMQSSMPLQVNNGWDMGTTGAMAAPYYQQMTPYPGMFDPQISMSMNMSDTTPYNVQERPSGSRSGASDFFRKVEIPKEFSHSRPNKKRFENVNNRQLTGRGIMRPNFNR